METWMLVVIVIIIIFFFASGMSHRLFGGHRKTGAPSTSAAPSDGPAPATSSATPAVSGDAQKESLEQQLITDGITATNCDSCQGDFSFASSDYGTPGIEFSEWAMYQTLDPRIVASNQQFVADRLGNPQTWTGATYSPDRHDTYDAVPWRGLSRPAQVAVQSPDQIPDLDTGRNPIVKKFRWDSSETE